MLLRYFTLLLLAAGQLSYLSKLMKEEQKSENTMVGKLASRHKHQASDAVQHQGSDALQQEGSNAVQLESSDAVQLEGYDAGQQEGYDAVQQEDSSVGQQEGNPRRHPRNISIPRLPPQNPENTLAQRLQELVAKYQEVSESIMPAVSRARQVIEGDTVRHKLQRLYHSHCLLCQLPLRAPRICHRTTFGSRPLPFYHLLETYVNRKLLCPLFLD